MMLVRNRSALALVASFAACLSACGSTSPDAQSPAPTATAAATAAPTAEPSATPTATAAATTAPTADATANAAPAKKGVPIETSAPPGAQPLTEDESKELTGKCKKLTDAVAAAAKKSSGKKRPVDIVQEVLAHPPKLPGVDLPRCGSLMEREMIDYLARTRENEAKLNLKRILVSLSTGMEASPPKWCASAGPTPPDLATVKDIPYQSTLTDWQAPGWKCAVFDLSGAPQVFQYELRTDAKAQSFEVIARGYPVRGAAATEIYVEGKVVGGKIDPSAPVLRRQ
ncbi:MAG: hypothetical protein U0441_24085 [Polyangiaceae bacterium]